eukprot:1135796-Amphidinium_carterae.2
MKDVRISARKALGKGARLRRLSPLELLAYGGTAGDPQITADLNAIRIWQRRLEARRLDRPLDNRAWPAALDRGRGRGPFGQGGLCSSPLQGSGDHSRLDFAGL